MAVKTRQDRPGVLFFLAGIIRGRPRMALQFRSPTGSADPSHMVKATLNGIRLASFLLVVYWSALFVGTHIPRPPQIGVHLGDKLLHFGAFLGLAFLLAWAIPKSRRHRILHLMLAGSIAAGYGALDEFTQIPVGRTADILDWLADLVGAVSGLVVYTVARHSWIAFRGIPQGLPGGSVTTLPTTPKVAQQSSM
jgi:VanZ family protein